MVKEFMINIETKLGNLTFAKIPIFTYQKAISQEIEENNINRKDCLSFLEQMLMIRTLEEMLAQINSGIYSPLPNYVYIGPTHLSIGQEAVSTGAISAIGLNDYITSSHRGHGDAIAKGYNAVKNMSDEDLKNLLFKRKKYLSLIKETYDANDPREVLEEKAIKIHVFRMIAELFGKECGYCGGIGGGMHIADFELGHLGANAIVGGHVPIATGAAISLRYQKNNNLVLCLAGDGAYSNGVVLESLNLASMAQFKNGLMEQKSGVPIIFAIVNNQYAMSGQENGEITGIDYLARRAAGFDLDNMHAEVIDGMDILAVLDAVKRASKKIKEGQGPVLLEFITYRYKGHSLSDPLTYRDKEELEKWQRKDPIENFKEKILKADFPKIQGGKITKEEIIELEKKIFKRNADMAYFVVISPPPADCALTENLFSSKNIGKTNKNLSNPKIVNPIPTYKRNANNQINVRFALREAIINEMVKDGSIVVFGEDVADYGGAFGVTSDLLKTFGRSRIFNTSISEAAIVGAAVGMAMTGLKPICEMMYGDFIMEALDQIGNQAAKWSFMSGGQVSIPMVLRTTIGGGKGYAGQHSQSLEALVTHIPGLKVVAPSNPYDSKGLLISAIRENNPIVFFEHQLIYNLLGQVPSEEYTVPLGHAKLVREGADITIICWSYMVSHAIKAAEQLEKEGISAEIIDIRTLIPLDIETIIASVKKTNRVIVTSQEVSQGAFVSEIITQIQENAFDWLDAPIIRLGAINSIPPSAQNLEKLFLPDAEKLVKKIIEIF